MPINLFPDYVLAEVRGGTGCTTIRLAREMVDVFFERPDDVAARLLGFSSVAQYGEWVEGMGLPLCAATTRRGKPCSLPCGPMSDAWTWRGLHRKAFCSVHEERGTR